MFVSGPGEARVSFGILVNCWNTLRAGVATTQPVKANVTAEKHTGLGNQQPSDLLTQAEGSTTRAKARSGQATAKCKGTLNESSRYSLSCSEMSRVRVASGRNTTDLPAGLEHHDPGSEPG